MMKWDLYDENLKKTETIINETDIIPEGFYHLSVELWIMNDQNEILLVKNAVNFKRHAPGLWSCIWDKVISGETSIEAMIRTINNRIGLKIQPIDLEDLGTIKRKEHRFAYTTFLVRKNINVKDLLFIDNNCTAAKWFTLNEIQKMINNGEVPPFMVSRIEEHIKPLI